MVDVNQKTLQYYFLIDANQKQLFCLTSIKKVINLFLIDVARSKATHGRVDDNAHAAAQLDDRRDDAGQGTPLQTFCACTKPSNSDSRASSDMIGGGGSCGNTALIGGKGTDACMGG